jgi:hypothetical protein
MTNPLDDLRRQGMMTEEVEAYLAAWERFIADPEPTRGIGAADALGESHTAITSLAAALVEMKGENTRLRRNITDRHFVDATPDDGLVRRILTAYIDEDTSWSDNTAGFDPTNLLVVAMNEAQARRNEILKAHLAAYDRDHEKETP